MNEPAATEVGGTQSFLNRLRFGEDLIALSAFFLLAFIPTLEVISRISRIPGIPAAPVLVQHLTLWVGFIGAILATRQGKLLALTTRPLFVAEETLHFGRWFARVISFLVVIGLTWGSLDLIRWEFLYPVEIAPNLPRWVAQLIIPLGYGIIGIQIFLKSSGSRIIRASFLMIAFALILLLLIGALQPSGFFVLVSAGCILVSLVFGAPIFVGLGGLALVLFWWDYTPVSSIPAESYRIVVSPTLPTLPLFTLAGYLLAESKASQRLFEVFRTLFGWIPGGTPIIVVVLSGFFTALTGGSGVTILALGGLLFPLLRKEGYSEGFALGLITVAGSLGLLFPPSLPAIIFGVTAGVSVKQVFIGGALPGALLVLAIAGWALHQERKVVTTDTKLTWSSVGTVLWNAKWELALPVLILFGIFGGFMTLVETAAVTVLYVLFIEVILYRDITWNQLPRIVVDCATLIGGVLIILGVAMGLTSYLVDAQIPMKLLAFVKSMVSSPWVFLMFLNGLLLIVGCLMDIFSAIIVIVPLIVPLSTHFGIHPVHLAVIFLANLELGFLTPPVGMNLFLSAYRFEKSMPVIYRATLPYFLIRLAVVLAITYLPVLSLFFLR
ncbi:MAG: TRAP transporter large permease subunit [Candidatus Neomarinimicrobiota bacterium]|nr:MAG: TRAP transporter large permease subunit [Candidatus Neomarinimicrobiota bacterium]